MKKQNKGIFCVSLDFEMFWGMQDAVTLEEYGQNVINGKAEGKRQLKLFDQYGIHATWGTVGFLLAENKTQLLRYIPEKKPSSHEAGRVFLCFYGSYGISHRQHERNAGKKIERLGWFT